MYHQSADIPWRLRGKAMASLSSFRVASSGSAAVQQLPRGVWHSQSLQIKQSSKCMQPRRSMHPSISCRAVHSAALYQPLDIHGTGTKPCPHSCALLPAAAAAARSPPCRTILTQSAQLLQKLHEGKAKDVEPGLPEQGVLVAVERLAYALKHNSSKAELNSFMQGRASGNLEELLQALEQAEAASFRRKRESRDGVLRSGASPSRKWWRQEPAGLDSTSPSTPLALHSHHQHSLLRCLSALRVLQDHGKSYAAEDAVEGLLEALSRRRASELSVQSKASLICALFDSGAADRTAASASSSSSSPASPSQPSPPGWKGNLLSLAKRSLAQARARSPGAVSFSPLPSASADSTLLPAFERAIGDVLLSSCGHELTLLKDLCNIASSNMDFHQLVFKNISSEGLRQLLLQHIAVSAADSQREGREMLAEQQRMLRGHLQALAEQQDVEEREVRSQAKSSTVAAAQPMSTITQRPLQVISDFDDTIRCGWIDKRYPRGTVYPGVLSLLRALQQSQHWTLGAFSTTAGAAEGGQEGKGDLSEAGAVSRAVAGTHSGYSPAHPPPGLVISSPMPGQTSSSGSGSGSGSASGSASTQQSGGGAVCSRLRAGTLQHHGLQPGWWTIQRESPEEFAAGAACWPVAKPAERAALSTAAGATAAGAVRTTLTEGEPGIAGAPSAPATVAAAAAAAAAVARRKLVHAVKIDEDVLDSMDSMFMSDGQPAERQQRGAQQKSGDRNASSGGGAAARIKGAAASSTSFSTPASSSGPASLSTAFYGLSPAARHLLLRGSAPSIAAAAGLGTLKGLLASEGRHRRRAASSGASSSSSTPSSPDSRAAEGQLPSLSAQFSHLTAPGARNEGEEVPVTADSTSTGAATGAADASSVWHPQLPSSLLILTARPPGYRGYLKQRTLEKLRTHSISSHILVLMGSLLRSGSTAAIFQKKYENLMQYAGLFPECSMVLLGDSGQGDAALAALARRFHSQQHFPLCIIHDVTGPEVSTTGDGGRKSRYKQLGIVFVETYAGAAAAAYEAGCLDLQTARAVGRAALEETAQLLRKGERVLAGGRRESSEEEDEADAPAEDEKEGAGRMEDVEQKKSSSSIARMRLQEKRAAGGFDAQDSPLPLFLQEGTASKGAEPVRRSSSITIKQAAVLPTKSVSKRRQLLAKLAADISAFIGTGGSRRGDTTSSSSSATSEGTASASIPFSLSTEGTDTGSIEPAGQERRRSSDTLQPQPVVARSVLQALLRDCASIPGCLETVPEGLVDEVRRWL